MKSEIIEFMKIRGWSREEAEKTYIRWFAWLTEVTTIHDVRPHFKAISEVKYTSMVTIKDIDVDLVCPHHLLPVDLVVHIAYIPNKKILGLSKFARVARDLARPITQEEYTNDLVEIISKNLEPIWIMAIVIGKHACMQCRGIKSKQSKTITSDVKTKLLDKSIAKSYKDEFMQLVF